MRIAVISDLHLGSGGSGDPFGHDDAEFLRFLRRLEASAEKIVLLGDVFETLRPASPATRPADELLRCRDAHREIATRFERPQYAFVHGNHDAAAKRLWGAPSSLEIESDGVKLHFEHGHAFDGTLHDGGSPIARAGAWASGWVLRAGLPGVYRALERLDSAVLQGVSAEPERCRFQKKAVAAAKARAADVIVTGHTHHPAIAEHGNHLYLNSGTCSGGRISFLRIDTAHGVFRIETEHGASGDDRAHDARAVPVFA